MSDSAAAMHGTIGRRPRTGMRWAVLALLCLLALINNIDRLALSVAAPAMQRELSLSAYDIGLLGSAFSLFYALGQLPSGWFVDRFGPRRLLGVAVAVWSVATAAMGLFSGLPGLVAARAALGLAEAPSLPCTNKIVTRWFPASEQGIANASWDAALKCGPACLTFVLIWLVAQAGWRSLFLTAGAAGLIFAAIFVLFYRDIDVARRVSPAERRYILDGQPAEDEATPIPLKALFGHPTMWGMMGGYFCNLWAYQILLVFIPLFIVRQFGVRFSDLGLVASVPWFGAIAGDILSGLISARLGRRTGWTTLRAKRVTIIVALVLQAATLLAIPLNGSLGHTAGLWFSVVLMGFALGFNGAVVAHAWSLPAELAPRHSVASVGAIQNFGGFLGATASPLVAGILVDVTHSFAPVFLISGCVALASAALYGLAVRRPITVSAR